MGLHCLRELVANDGQTIMQAKYIGVNTMFKIRIKHFTIGVVFGLTLSYLSLGSV
jgi:hypothetical protein